MIQNNKEIINSQSLLSVNEIRDGVLILKNSALRTILKISGMNLDLKSEDEQNAVIHSWRTLLNNLDFSLEIIIQSRRLNVEPYITLLKEKVSKEYNELLQTQGEDYINFINEFVNLQKTMEKTFYVVVPYDPVILQTSSLVPQVFSGIKEMLKISREIPSIQINEEEFRRAQQQLLIRKESLIVNFHNLGLEAIPLNTQEMIDLLFNFYNPEIFDQKTINIQ